MYEISEIASLIKKKWEGSITSREEDILRSWAQADEERIAVLDKIEDDEVMLEDVFLWLELQDEKEGWLDRLQHKTFSKIQSARIVDMNSGIRNGRKGKVILRKLLPYAASVIAISLIVFSYYIISKPSPEKETRQIVMVNDLKPGTNRATITMANGKVIELSEDKEGVILGEQLIYEDGSIISEISPDVQMQSVLQTPKGGSYQIKLNDGTRVWLNAESKLTYPLKFNGEHRIVKLEGEAFFDVASSLQDGKKVPFIVQTEGQQVEVLGTQFNVMAYRNEPKVQTTLVEGIVKVGNLQLTPGEQIVGDETGLSKRRVDVEQYTAWKNDEFVFNETELKDAMRMLARWYDFEVFYEGKLAPSYLYGSISRKKGLAEVLKIMETSGLKFKIQKTGSTNQLIVN